MSSARRHRAISVSPCFFVRALLSFHTMDARANPKVRKAVRRGVIGILEREGRFLMIQRAPGVTKPGTWCFPGGHVEPTETSRQAVVRELGEELGIRVEAIRRLGAVRVPESRYILAVWKVAHLGGEFVLAEKEIADMRWLDVEEIAGITPGLPSNAMVYRLLCPADSPG